MGIQDMISKLGGQQAAMQQIQGLFGATGKQGIVEKLTSAGMGQHVQSWIGMGENQPVSGQQVQQAMDPAKLQQLAQRLGMPQEQVSDHVAQVLPHLMDQATPDGTLPEEGSGMGTKAKDAMRNMFGR